MGALTSRDRVAVTIDGQNIIYILPKMGLGAKTRVEHSRYKVVQSGDGSPVEAELSLAAAQIMLMQENIVDWDGPDFVVDGAKLPCTRQNIEEYLDPDDPLVEKAGDEIAKRNAVQVGPTSPNSLNGGGAGSPASSPPKKKSAGSTSIS